MTILTGAGSVRVEKCGGSMEVRVQGGKNELLPTISRCSMNVRCPSLSFPPPPPCLHPLPSAVVEHSAIPAAQQPFQKYDQLSYQGFEQSPYSDDGLVEPVRNRRLLFSILQTGRWIIFLSDRNRLHLHPSHFLSAQPDLYPRSRPDHLALQTPPSPSGLQHPPHGSLPAHSYHH